MNKFAQIYLQELNKLAAEEAKKDTKKDTKKEAPKKEESHTGRNVALGAAGLAGLGGLGYLGYRAMKGQPEQPIKVAPETLSRVGGGAQGGAVLGHEIAQQPTVEKQNNTLRMIMDVIAKNRSRGGGNVMPADTMSGLVQRNPNVIAPGGRTLAGQ